MGVRANGRRDRGIVRWPTVGEAVEQLVSQGVVFGVGGTVVGATGSPFLWWAVAALMVFVAARGMTVLRNPPPRTRSAWGAAVYPGRSQGEWSFGAAAGLTGYSTFGGGLDGAGGGGDGGC